MELSTIDRETVRIQDVQVDEDDLQGFVHVMEVGQRNAGKPTMVLIHGYAAGGGLFYKILKRLGERFHILVLDLIGMGGSGRPNYPCTDSKSCEEYYVDSIEKFR